MKPDIYIRVDGSSKIGLGHVIRCMAYADMLKSVFEITFFFKELPEQSKIDIQNKGFNLIIINNEENFLKRITSDLIVILDGYHFDLAYQKKIKLLGCKLVCIDDIHDKEFAADLIINHAPGITPQDYKTQANTQFALGLEYVLLRHVFLEQARVNRIIEKLEVLIICFGGSDIKNLTETILEKVLPFNELKKIIVVTGSSYVYLETLVQVIKRDNRIKAYHSIDEGKMLDLLKEADIAIVPTSGILLEALATGCKVVAGMYVENQKVLFEQFKLLKAFESAVNFENNSVEIALTNLLNSKTQPIKLIDGKSGKRHLLKILQLITSIREINQSDCNQLFEWANDELVRRNAISKEPIILENHIKWFNSKINSKDSKIFILEFNKKAIGQIRYDKIEDYWIIDYSIDSGYRGLGFGKKIIQDSFLFLKNCKTKAIVQEKNVTSVNIFNSLNFENTGIENINNEVYFTFEFRI